MTALPPGWALGLLMLRLAVGATFVAHGWPKLHREPWKAETASFTRHGIPYPGAAVRLVGVTQVLCGVLLVIGLAARAAALPLAFSMAVAVAVVKRRGPFAGGSDFPLLLLVCCLALALLGPGPWAVGPP